VQQAHVTAAVRTNSSLSDIIIKEVLIRVASAAPARMRMHVYTPY
jgi:hypothetical protein